MSPFGSDGSPFYGLGLFVFFRPLSPPPFKKASLIARRAGFCHAKDEGFPRPGPFSLVVAFFSRTVFLRDLFVLHWHPSSRIDAPLLPRISFYQHHGCPVDPSVKVETTPRLRIRIDTDRLPIFFCFSFQ